MSASSAETASQGDEAPAAEHRPPRHPMQDATRLLLIRHGASEPARPGRSFPMLDRHRDPELTDEGREQAVRIAEHLCGEDIRAIYVSTLRRTVQSADPLAARLGLTPSVEPDLREAHLGEWEGSLYATKVAENGPIVQRVWRDERWDLIPGAESADAFAGRIHAVIDRLVAKHTGEQIAIISHGGVIAEILARATRSRPFAFVGADHGSISQVFAASPHWILRRFNDTAHLRSAAGDGSASPPDPEPAKPERNGAG